MADWQRTLFLQPEWDWAQDDQITRQELASVTADRLRRLKPFGLPCIDDTRDEIVDAFETISQDPGATADDFNQVMVMLYDWADTQLDSEWNGKRVCWVNIFDRKCERQIEEPKQSVGDEVGAEH